MATQVSKLNYVDAKLGAPTSGQQTTRILFNTVVGGGPTFEFFKSFQGLTNGQTNLTQNKLDSMESMVIKSISFGFVQATGSMGSLGLSGQTCSIIVGNQKVVKNLPISFNVGSTGQAFDRLHEGGGASLPGSSSQFVQGILPAEVRLLTDIVIPPQVSFEVRLDTGVITLGNNAIVCALSGYGKIFSAGMSF